MADARSRQPLLETGAFRHHRSVVVDIAEDASCLQVADDVSRSRVALLIVGPPQVRRIGDNPHFAVEVDRQNEADTPDERVQG
jgi:hypothetical protein